ncbi:unnamed protein product [Adineta ricciae]|uniref:Uncharacterized protein n=1 Tax=Adineta ricciae TaxID=249248 RepID=A0A815M183_ADIRI|nr:unnamed protein product [Adineta ricciae]
MATVNDNTSSSVAEEDINRNKSFKLYQTIAYAICVVTCHLGLYLGLIALFYCWFVGSLLGLSYAISALMNSICSFFVFWHLKGQTPNDLERRDYLVCCINGALIFGSFLGIKSHEIQLMIDLQTPTGDWFTRVYSVIHIISFITLSIVKLVLSTKLKSKSLFYDTLSSITGIVLSIALILRDRISISKGEKEIIGFLCMLTVISLPIISFKLIFIGIVYQNKLYRQSFRQESNNTYINVHTTLLSSSHTHVIP